MGLADAFKSIFDLSKWTDKAFVNNERKKGFEFMQDIYPGSPYALTGEPVGNISSIFDNLDGNSFSFSYGTIKDAIVAYQKCPPVTSIVNKKAQAFVNGKTWVLNTQGKAKGKEATTAEAVKVRNLFNNPNPLQSGRQFEAQNYIYQQLCGYAVVLVVKPFGFSIKDATALWNLPPQLLEINEKRFKPYSIKKVTDIIDSVFLVYEDERVRLNVDDLVIIRDFVPSFGSPIIPESRIRSCSMAINNIIGAYESRNVLINQRGPQRVVSSNKTDDSGNIPLNQAEKDQLHRDFQKYGLRKNQVQEIITAANINVTPIGFSTKDLMLFEEIEGSTMTLCDGLAYPYRLMAAEKAASYNDVNEFKKMLYQDTIIPEGESVYSQWDTALGLSELNLRLDKDYSHIPALQADAKQMAEARRLRNEALEREFRYNNITLNRWRELNGEDTTTDGNIFFSEFKKLYGDPYQKDVGPQQNNGGTNGSEASANDNNNGES